MKIVFPIERQTKLCSTSNSNFFDFTLNHKIFFISSCKDSTKKFQHNNKHITADEARWIAELITWLRNCGLGFQASSDVAINFSFWFLYKRNSEGCQFVYEFPIFVSLHSTTSSSTLQGKRKRRKKIFEVNSRMKKPRRYKMTTVWSLILMKFQETPSSILNDFMQITGYKNSHTYRSNECPGQTQKEGHIDPTTVTNSAGHSCPDCSSKGQKNNFKVLPKINEKPNEHY